MAPAWPCWTRSIACIISRYSWDTIFGTEIEVIAGLNAGDLVIVHPGDDLAEGILVELREFAEEVTLAACGEASGTASPQAALRAYSTASKALR